MKVGVVKEIKSHEYRVGLTPEAAREYVAAGHRLIVETGAGNGIGAVDTAYEAAGAEIAGCSDEVFRAADMIVKVKEPQPAEFKKLREGLILFTYLHLAPDPPQANGLMKSGCTAVAYETVTDGRGGLPLLAPMSEVAGRLAVDAATMALKRHTGGRGLLIGGVPGVSPARIVVIGAGVVGTQVARMAAGLGADVVVLDRSLPRLRKIDDLSSGRVRTRFSTLQTVEDEIVSADVVIGAVLVPGASAPRLITRSMLASMKRGAVLIDVAIDQGGCFETSRPTTLADPTYEVNGIIHYCVANMPGAVPLTSSYALNNATLPFGLALASQGIRALVDDPNLAAGLNVHRGAITNRAIAESLGTAFTEPGVALAA